MHCHFSVLHLISPSLKYNYVPQNNILNDLTTKKTQDHVILFLSEHYGYFFISIMPVLTWFSTYSINAMHYQVVNKFPLGLKKYHISEIWSLYPKCEQKCDWLLPPLCPWPNFPFAFSEDSFYFLQFIGGRHPDYYFSFF